MLIGQYCRAAAEIQASPGRCGDRICVRGLAEPTRFPYEFEATERRSPKKTPNQGVRSLAETVHPVHLVGAGPGDPELLTLKALRVLQAADVVVYDKLVSEAILALIPAGAMRIFAGKVARNHHMPQPEINTLLVSLARSGRRVVRLKGGDPFLFGRGGEEAEALAGSGLAFVIIPGVTSASGCTAYAGIPLTHRGLAHGVRFVTGHTQDENGALDLNWSSLADPDTTLVVYMGRTNVRQIADRLIAHGLPADTPAAAIIDGTRPEQETILTTLADLPERIAARGRTAPTLLVIGKVVALAEALAWLRPGDPKEGGSRVIG
jgi:uroporphyrin-III C-methyltransferase/precorrin-2 dehydrogenase/sirohydrochlorin ferrochelatase/uroporphyrin-III C-methyltransferase